MLTGTILVYTRGFNRRIVFETIQGYGPIARADIARMTALAFQTVAIIVQELMHQALVVAGGRRQGRRESPSVEVQINPEGAYGIRLNLDRDRLTGVLVDLSGAVHARADHDPTDTGPGEVLTWMKTTAERFLRQVERRTVWDVGVGVPGPLHLDDATERVPDDLHAWQGTHLCERLTERLAAPVVLERNADAAAIGEHWYGATAPASFYYVFVGMGLGGSAVVEGCVHRGSSRLAGKIGDIPVPPWPTADGSTSLRTLKDVLSLAAVYARLERQGRRLRGAGDLEATYRTGDPAMLAWLQSAAATLAPHLLTIDYLFDCDTIVFGGRLPRPLLQHVLRSLELELAILRTPQKARHPTLRDASVTEDPPPRPSPPCPSTRPWRRATTSCSTWRRVPEAMGRTPHDRAAAPPAPAGTVRRPPQSGIREQGATLSRTERLPARAASSRWSDGAARPPTAHFHASSCRKDSDTRRRARVRDHGPRRLPQARPGARPWRGRTLRPAGRFQRVPQPGDDPAQLRVKAAMLERLCDRMAETVDPHPVREGLW